jgi:hypothetical protein
MSGDSDILSAALAEALDGHQCVSAWLGHHTVLFLGLGTAVLADRGEDGRRSSPPYEVQTNLAEWSVEWADGPVIHDHDRPRAEAAARALVGRSVSGWHLCDENTLRVRFFAGPILTIVPMADGQSADKAAWWVCLPGGRTVAVACNGRVVAADSRRAICDWFDRPIG